MSDVFTTWFAENKGDVPRRVGGIFNEPAEAADAAEEHLRMYGLGGESYCEIRFNGDSEPHTIVILIDDDDPPTFGVWNTDSALWPIFYADSPYGTMLEGNPLDEIEADEGQHKKDEDAGKMDLGGQDDEDEADTESEDDSEEFPDDENEDDDEELEDESEDDEAPSDGADEEDDSDDEDFNDEDEGSSDDDSDSDEQDDDDENEGEDDDEDGESEDEMPRLNIFAKMRGPKGWRKRAEAEELQERNVFGLKIGILDAEAEKPGQQERNVVAHVEFIEADTTRDHGVLKLRLPEGVTLDDFTQTKAGVISVKVPYTQD